MRTHTISAKAVRNRKHECFLCGKMVTPAVAAVEFCSGRPVVEKQKKGRRG